MARELESYRDILEDMLCFFDGKRLLSVSDTARYLHCDRKTVRNRYGITSDGITAPALARKLAKLSSQSTYLTTGRR